MDGWWNLPLSSCMRGLHFPLHSNKTSKLIAFLTLIPLHITPENRCMRNLLIAPNNPLWFLLPVHVCPRKWTARRSTAASQGDGSAFKSSELAEALLHGVYMSSSCLRGFPQGTVASSHRTEDQVNCLKVWMWAWIIVCLCITPVMNWRPFPESNSPTSTMLAGTGSGKLQQEDWFPSEAVALLIRVGHIGFSSYLDPWWKPQMESSEMTLFLTFGVKKQISTLLSINLTVAAICKGDLLLHSLDIAPQRGEGGKERESESQLSAELSDWPCLLPHSSCAVFWLV